MNSFATKGQTCNPPAFPCFFRNAAASISLVIFKGCAVQYIASRVIDIPGCQAYPFSSKRQQILMTTTPEERPAAETGLAVIEAQISAVQDGQRQIISRLDAMEQTNNARFDSLNSRIDRLFYTILALGIAAIGTPIALDKIF